MVRRAAVQEFLRHHPRIITRLDFAAGTAWLLSSALMAWLAYLGPGEDFRGYYAAAQVVLAHGNPYDYHTLAPVLRTLTGTAGNNPYFYAPWFAWLIIPFAWLPFQAARALWMLLNLAVWDLSLWRLAMLLNWPKANWQRCLLFLPTTVAFAWFTWRCEQTSVLLFAILLAALLAFRERKWIWVGVWLALFIIKPNITLIPALAILLWFVRQRIWQPVFSAIAITSGLLLGASLITPNWYLSFFEPGFGQGIFNGIDGPGTDLGPRLHTTLNDWLLMFQVQEKIIQVLCSVVFIVGLACVFVLAWKSASMLQVVVVAVLTSFAVTPYALQYDYALLALVFVWGLALAQQGRERWTIVVGNAIAVFVVSVPFWERPISDGYWMVIGLAGLAAWNWYNADRSQISVSLP